jgi:DNA-binding NtrC family response regulator
MGTSHTDHSQPVGTSVPPRSILIVDDDEGVRTMMSRWIDGLGYRPFIARDADEALAILRAESIDVALVDIKMPGRDGVWLIKEMQRAFMNTAIVVATGNTSMDPAVTLSPGVIAYVTKPFDLDRLESAVDAALASRSDLSAVRPSRLIIPGQMHA